MKLDVFARTDVGLVRSQNEDAYSVWVSESDGGGEVAATVLTVADGMGGHPGGEVASSIAVEVAQEVAAGNPANPHQLLESIFSEATERIRRRGDEEPRYKEMGTTLTSVKIIGGLAHVGHIGDTRLYWVRQNRWVQVTKDHNVAQELVDSGKLDPEAAEDHPMSNVLTRCLGVCPENYPDVLEGALQLENGDALLLASDGLAKTVHQATLEELTAGLDASGATAKLVDAALAGGAPDNVTVILARVVDVGSAEQTSGAVHTFDSLASAGWYRPG